MKKKQEAIKKLKDDISAKNWKTGYRKNKNDRKKTEIGNAD